MLATQVSYWANQETKRHNVESERQNLIDLDRKQNEYELEISRLNEVIRHNMTSESIDADKAKAAIISAKAAKKQAETALKKVKADIAVSKANIKVAQSNVQLNKAKTQLTRSQKINTKASKAKIEAETKGQKLKNKFYLITDVINPTVGNVSKLISLGTGKSR